MYSASLFFHLFFNHFYMLHFSLTIILELHLLFHTLHYFLHLIQLLLMVFKQIHDMHIFLPEEIILLHIVGLLDGLLERREMHANKPLA